MASVFKTLLSNADESKRRKNTLCGRAIQYRELSADEVQEADADALRQMKEPPQTQEQAVELRKLEWREGCMAMLVAVSKRDGLTKEQFLKLTEDDWVKVNPAMLTTHPVYSFDLLFRRSKDLNAIVALYRKLHEVTNEEIDDIMGKAIEVSTESAE